MHIPSSATKAEFGQGLRWPAGIRLFAAWQYQYTSLQYLKCSLLVQLVPTVQDCMDHNL